MGEWYGSGLGATSGAVQTTWTAGGEDMCGEAALRTDMVESERAGERTGITGQHGNFIAWMTEGTEGVACLVWLLTLFRRAWRGPVEMYVVPAVSQDVLRGHCGLREHVHVGVAGRECGRMAPYGGRDGGCATVREAWVVCPEEVGCGGGLAKLDWEHVADMVGVGGVAHVACWVGGEADSGMATAGSYRGRGMDRISEGFGRRSQVDLSWMNYALPK